MGNPKKYKHSRRAKLEKGYSNPDKGEAEKLHQESRQFDAIWGTRSDLKESSLQAKRNRKIKKSSPSKASRKKTQSYARKKPKNR